MKVFDLHCDTLFKANETGKSVVRNDFEFSMEKAESYESYTQVMAIWIPDEYRKERAFHLAEACYRRLNREVDRQNVFLKADNYAEEKSNYTVILSVEGGAVLGGDIEKEAYDGDGVMINSDFLNGYDNKKDNNSPECIK